MEGDPKEAQRAIPTVIRVTDTGQYLIQDNKVKGFPWSDLGQVADIDNFHGVIWDKGVTSCRSVVLFTGLTMRVLILVNYSPIWKCEYSWESRELF